MADKQRRENVAKRGQPDRVAVGDKFSAAVKLIEDVAADITRDIERLEASIDELKPRGWRKAVFWLRQVGPLATIISVFLALFGITLGALYQSYSHVKEDSKFRSDTENDLKDIKGQMTGLRALIAASQPNRKPNQVAAKEILAQAKDRLIPEIPLPIVERAGRSFVEAAANDPEAWNVAMQFAGYRSSLSGPISTNGAATKRLPNGIVRFVRTRRFPKGSEPALVKELTSTTALFTVPLPEVLVWDGEGRATVALDGLHCRHVTFYRARITYSDGPVRLEDIDFVDCTFEIANGIKGRALTDQILSKPSIWFDPSMIPTDQH